MAKVIIKSDKDIIFKNNFYCGPIKGGCYVVWGTNSVWKMVQHQAGQGSVLQTPDTEAVRPERAVST